MLLIILEMSVKLVEILALPTVEMGLNWKSYHQSPFRRRAVIHKGVCTAYRDSGVLFGERVSTRNCDVVF